MKHLARLLLFLSLLWAPKAHATVLAGTLKLPNGTPVTGTLNILLTKPGIRDLCTSPASLVPTTPVQIQVANGVIQGSTDILPNDCFNSFWPYKVTFKDYLNTLLFTSYWYIMPIGGGYGLPGSGSLFLAPVGLTLSSMSGSSNPVGWQITETQVAFKIGTVTLAPSGSSTATGNVSWGTPVTWSNYGVVCTYVDGTNISTSNVYVSSVSVVSPLTVSVTVTNNDGSAHSGMVTCRAR